MDIRDYRELDVYKRAYKLALEIHKFSLTWPKFELYENGSQIRRASKSICNNIGEGHTRKSMNEFKLYLTYALASAEEVTICLDFAHDCGYGTKEQYEYFFTGYKTICKQLTRYIQSLAR